jgi:hypothetical protein
MKPAVWCDRIAGGYSAPVIFISVGVIGNLLVPASPNRILQLPEIFTPRGAISASRQRKPRHSAFSYRSPKAVRTSKVITRSHCLGRVRNTLVPLVLFVPRSAVGAAKLSGQHPTRPNSRTSTIAAAERRTPNAFTARITCGLHAEQHRALLFARSSGHRSKIRSLRFLHR